MTSPIDAVGPQATLPATYDPSNAKLNATGTGKPPEMLDSQAFLQLLVAQLKYQDPTNPVDTSNFMNQTAMLSQVQTMNAMSSTLTDMFTAQQTSSATSMLGKAISFVDPAGNQVAGIVDAVSMNRGVAMLHVGELAVPLSGVLAVANPLAVDDGGVDPDAPVDGVDGVDGASDSDGADSAGDAVGTGAADGADGSAAGYDDPAAASAGPPDGSDTGMSASTDSTGEDVSAPVTRPDIIAA